MTKLSKLRELLLDSHLLTDAAVDADLSEWRGQLEGEESSESFVTWLIANERLTEFQGEALLAGHVGPFMLGPYEVQQHLASGRLGGVFRAVHREFEQAVSLKLFSGAIDEEPEKLARMGREVRILIELDHPNVVRSYQVGRIAGRHYLAMEELRGETLQAKLDHSGRLTFKEACTVVRNVAQGLGHLHANGVIHRDLRPDAIWLNDDAVPKIFEFSGARDPLSFLDITGGRDVTTTETVIGDYRYMAPEQAENLRDADQRSDIYALGCIFYHCLTGHPPFVEKNPIKLVLKHARDAPRPPSSVAADIPTQIDETISGMLAKAPKDRFQNADEVAFALTPYVDAEAEMISVVPVSDEYLRWTQERHPKDQDAIPPDAIGITPELTKFLGWMGKKKIRRKR